MSSHSNVRRHILRTTLSGFGLVELMVSISIMMLLSAVILTRHTAFSGAVLLRNEAYDVAFAIRKAQLLAVSGTNNGAATTTQQYGVYFDTAAGSNQAYFIFHDRNANGQWDGIDVQVGLLEHLDSRFVVRRIAKLDGTNLSGTPGFSITFIRPNFDAKFKDEDDVGYRSGSAYIDIATVAAAAKFNDHGLGSVRRVLVTTTGQISVVGF